MPYPGLQKGSRNLAGTRNDSMEDIDLLHDARGRPVPEDTFEDDFVSTHRRFKERAAAAFEDDLAELRRKRRDMQDRMFDMIDINAEIERAKNTLEAAGTAFQRHATKFDNDEDLNDLPLSQKIERSRKLAVLDPIEKPKPKMPSIKWTKMQEQDEGDSEKFMRARQARINSLIADNVLTETPGENQPKRRSSFLKRKKSVSF
ncbi:uncharacterized protein LOC107271255 [Cephus cinctus]|uniref:Uncharacterized protein LOC107271255 n=1 Tax=Cephus cinctus TaxID=211228 RepID=A0AAJ7C5K4_CEPCN|nr:uncharacterized protein LOC107271255 [Cephus cinctus]